jgi:hypothetical protein
MKIRQLAFFALLGLGSAGLLGCKSGGEPGSYSHAANQIKGHSLETIQQTATAVFAEEGYSCTGTTANEMVFDRPGSRRDALKWGGWSGQGVTMRVKVRFNPMADGSYVLQGDAYAVQNSSDPFFQSESRNIILNHYPYQKLLDKVAKRLKTPA